MQQNHNEYTLKGAIEEMLSLYRLSGKVVEKKAIDIFFELIGNTFAPHISDVYIKNKILFVRVLLPSLRNELNYTRTKLLIEINKRLDESVLSNIIFM